MVVECKKCGTRFQLDSARIPEDGIRVRCSRCKNAFHLQHPAQSRAGAVEAVVEEAVAREDMSPPDTSQDLTVAQDSQAGDMSIGSADADDLIGSDDEDDWEFNEDLPDCDDDPEEEPNDPSAAEAFEEDDFSLDFDDVGSIDLDHDQSFGSASASDVADLGDPGGSSALDSGSGETSSAELSATNMSIDMSASARPAEPAEASQTPAGAREEAFGSAGDFSNLMKPDELPPVATPETGQDEVVEDPEDWDFFGESEEKGPSQTSDGSGPMTKTDSDAAASQLQTSPKEIEDPGAWKGLEGDRTVSGIARVAAALAWVAVLGLLAAGVYFGVAESVDRRVSAPAFVDVGEMRVANLRGRFLETARAGTLYVVTGDLVNPGNVKRALHHTLLVSLLGEGGRELDSPAAVAGLETDFDLLRQMSTDELQHSGLIGSQSLSTREIEPGGSASFAAAFIALPEAASHFRLRALRSERAAQPSLAAAPVISAGDAQ